MVSLEKGLTFDEVKEYANESQEACNEALRYCNDVESMQYLIDHKADVNASAVCSRDTPGTPIWYYIVHCDRFDDKPWTSEEEDEKNMNTFYEIIKLLLKNGADVSKVNCCGETVLFHVSDFKLLEIFLNHYDNEFVRDLINTKNNGGRTLLHYRLNSLFVELLLKLGADPNVRDDNGDTPLHAVFRYDAAELLLKYGADPNIRNNNGETPLHYQYIWLNDRRFNLLMCSGAEINAQDNKGDTLLHRCLGYRKYYADTKDVLNKVLQSGADIHIKNNKGISPFDDDFLKDHIASVPSV